MVLAALWSSKFFTRNAAEGLSQHFAAGVDVLFGDGNRPWRFGRRSEKVAASRTLTRKPTLSRSESRRVIPSSSSPDAAPFGTGVTEQHLGNRGLDSCICRANSFDRSGLPDRENDEDLCGTESLNHGRRPGVKDQPQPDAGKQRSGNGEEEESDFNGEMRFRSMLSLKFDGFRRSSSLDFEDEFFTRMMALEATHNASGIRAPNASATFFDATGASEPARPAVQEPPTQGSTTEALGALGMGGVQLPSSIKKLRRSNRSVPQSKEPQGCAIRNAFSSMVYMIKAVQSHALHIRQVLFSEWDVQEVLLLVHRELHSSFVWLFQQVFACTPKLMVSVMILLANFTVYSMGENVAIATVTETPAPIAYFLSNYGNPQASLDPHFAMNYSQSFSKTATDNPLSQDPSTAGSGGNNNSPSPRRTDSFDGDAWLNEAQKGNYMFSQKDSIRDAPARRDHGEKHPSHPSHHEMMMAWVESSMKELHGLQSGLGEAVQQQYVQLEQETIRRLVAPVVAHLELDNYACFDRTDLEYQHALSKDPSNPLLLANYAQFLYVVRHDHDRAESYFHQAMQSDPLDSAILGRFASFLWLGRGNRSAAERAYKAAMAADPDSSFPASNYAHFLWHIGDSGESSSTSGPSVRPPSP